MVLRGIVVVGRLALWTMSATGARLIGEHFGLGPFATDWIGGTAILLIALVCWFETRTALGTLLTFVPIYGQLHSARCFWRLAARNTRTAPVAPAVEA